MTSPDPFAYLAPAGAPDVGFRQGTVVAFNQSTGANTISVAGAVLTDLPVVSSSESLEITAGDVVVLMRLKSSWCILGKVVVPGGVLASSALAFDQVFDGTTNNFATVNGTTTLVTVNITVPAPFQGAGCEALVTAYVSASVLNNSGATRSIAAGVLIGGTGGAFGSAQSIPNTNQGNSSTTRSRIVSAPGATIAIAGQITSGAVIAADVANQFAIGATAIFRRT